MKRILVGILYALIFAYTVPVNAQQMHAETYCNPVNIDYTYMIYNSNKDISYRSGADPAVVGFRGEYFMFVTRSLGYWHSTDLQNWDFIVSEKWYFEGCNAPAAHNYRDSVLYVTGNPSGQMSILYTDNPKKGDWKIIPSILTNLQDPDLFIDDNGETYMFWGSSNKFPIKGKKLNKEKRFIANDEVVELFNLQPDKHGWERFGDNHSHLTLTGYLEGAWLTKYNNKYYMQYAAPGTEFNVYGDGVYIADNPLGPYSYQNHNPVSYKPGGFINGAGHGSTVLGPSDQYWHFATMALSVNRNWERRICLFPLYFDKDEIMYCDTRFGDYPHYAPTIPGKKGEFRGWMLLSYKKPVKSSSFIKGNEVSDIVDENIKTYWLAESNSDEEWVEIDLENEATVYAIQVNYFDHKSDMYGKIPGLYHRYMVQGSVDGKKWFVLVDKTKNFKDVPNDYVELDNPKKVRFVRYSNIHVPTPHLAISDIRIFGLGTGNPPEKVKNLKLNRYEDRRDVTITWDSVSNCQGYNVIWGISPDKMYSSWMVYDENSLLLKCLNTDQEYYFTIEAFNENGVSERTGIIKID